MPDAARQDPVPPPRDGSSARFALLFSPPRVRPALQALLAFRSEIDEVLLKPLDSSVRSVKLAWWADEISRLGEGQPRHPITRQLLSFLSPGDHQLLMSFLESTAAWLEPSADGKDALQSYLAASGGTLGEMASRLADAGASGQPAALRRPARALGTGIRGTALARLALVSPSVLGRFSGSATRDDCFDRCRTFSAEQLSAGFRDFPAAETRRQRGLLVMAKLYERLNRKLSGAADGKLVELSPPVKLWTAWRTARSTSGIEPDGTQ
jgi:phytoene/squalene synthetase